MPNYTGETNIEKAPTRLAEVIRRKHLALAKSVVDALRSGDIATTLMRQKNKSKGNHHGIKRVLL
jgi:hypothetical protein